jgi:uncharacterized protein YjbI with pentapeptide repeats
LELKLPALIVRDNLPQPGLIDLPSGSIIGLFVSLIVDHSTAKEGSVPVPGRKIQGLRKLSSDAITKAIDETNAQIVRIGFTLVGTTTFCLLSLLSPDSALLGGSEKINVPLAGPVSFFGFMLLGPAVLIMLRAYLQIYVEHRDRLDRLARLMLLMRAPTLVPLKNPLIRFLGGCVLYLLLPVTVMLFVWKAAVFPTLGTALSVVAVAVIVGHAMVPLSRLNWRSRALLSAAAAAVAWGLIFDLGSLRRPFDLYHANLSGQWLVEDNLRNANLVSANLSGADLAGANLSRANLSRANLSTADLQKANLSGAKLNGANLNHATLWGADLSGADLVPANLNGADLGGANLSHANLSRADLSGINLWFANLSLADLRLANLDGANLGPANLSGAKLRSARMNGAKLGYANLSGADLHNTDLGRALLSGAKLNSADLGFADLSGADLGGADLSGAKLKGADLSGAKNLTQKQLNEACGDEGTELPEGLTLKPCPG